MVERADRLEESRRLSGLIVAIADQAKLDFAEAVAPFGLPVHLARAILRLGAPAPMGDLAEHLACDRSYITGLADKLEERGLLTRVPGDDRRVKLLQLTDEGQDLRDLISAAVTERSRVLRNLDDDQRRTLEPLLQALLDRTPDTDQ